MSEAAPVPADQEEALRDRYTVVYEGDPDGMKILSGEPAPGRAVTVIVGDQWEEVATLRAERDQLASELREAREALKPFAEVCGAEQMRWIRDEQVLELATRAEVPVSEKLRGRDFRRALAALSDPRPSPTKGDAATPERLRCSNHGALR